jgi:hypothetical protein
MNFKNVALDWVAEARRATVYHREDGVSYIETKQDVEPLIEWTKARAQGVVDDPDYKFVATIPEATLNQAFAEGWFHDQKAWRRWMDENPKFTAKWHK